LVLIGEWNEDEEELEVGKEHDLFRIV